MLTDTRGSHTSYRLITLDATCLPGTYRELGGDTQASNINSDELGRIDTVMIK